MSNLEVLQEVEKELPESFIYGIVKYNNSELTLDEFLRTYVIPKVNGSINKDKLKQMITDKFGKMVKEKKPDITKEQFVDEFIKKCDHFVSEIRVSETVTLNTRDELLSRINSNFKFDVGIKEKSIYEMYNTLLNNEYKEVTLEDKIEICEYYLNYYVNELLQGKEISKEELLASKIDGINYSIKEYVMEILPSKMINEVEAKINNSNMTVDEIIMQVIVHQIEYIEKKQQEKIEEFNRTNENPGLVAEIQTELNKDNQLEVTSQIEIPGYYDLDENEVGSLLNVLDNNDKKDNIKDNLNLIKQSILTSKTVDDLDQHIAYYNEIKKDINVSDEYTKALIESIDKLIGEKRKNIIKTASNKEDYIDAILGKISDIEKRISGFTETSDFDTVYGEITLLEDEIAKKDIFDEDLKYALKGLKKYANQNHIIVDSLAGNELKGNLRAKNEIDFLIDSLSNKLKSLQYLNSEIKLATIEIQANDEYNILCNKIEEYNAKGSITDEERNQYMNIVNNYMSVHGLRR